MNDPVAQAAAAPTAAPAEVSISEMRRMLAGEPEPAAPAATEPEKPAAEVRTDPASEPDANAGKQRGPDGKFVTPPAAAEDNAGDEALTPNAQKRINALVAKQRQAERERDDALARLATPGSQPANQPAKPAEPQSKKRPVSTDYDSYEKYNADVITFEIDEREAIRAGEAQARQQAEKFTASLTTFKATHPDFDEKMALATGLPITREMHNAICEEGPALAYHLATHPEDATLLALLSGKAVERAIGAIMAKLETPAAAGAAAAAPATTNNPTTPAAAAAPRLPRPPAAVGGGHAPTEVDLNDPDLNMRTFKAEFQRRMKGS